MASRKVHREKPEDALDDLFNLDRNALPNDPRIDEIVNQHMSELGAHLTNPKDRDRVPVRDGARRAVGRLGPG